MIKNTSPNERQADTFTEIKTCLEEISAPIYSDSFRNEHIGDLENTLREYSELHEIQMPTQIESYILEILEFIPRLESCLKACSQDSHKLATDELRSRLGRLLSSLSDEIEDLQQSI